MDINIIVIIGTIEGPIYYINRFIDYLIYHGVNHLIVDSSTPESYESSKFKEFLKLPNVVMFTFNNFCIHLRYNNNVNVWKYNNIPVFDYIVDHPRNFHDSMKKPEEDLYVFSLDRDHVNYIKKWYPFVKGVYFSPNGGTEVNSHIPFNDRKYDVIYMGGCQEKIVDYPIIPFFEDEGKDFYTNTLDLMFHNTILSTENAIDLYFKNNNIKISEEKIYYLNKNIALYLENTIRRKTKLMGMKALDDAGVHVDVFGGNSFKDDGIIFSNNIRLHDRLPRVELMPLIGQAKLSHCFMPWFKRGCSEKNLDSMLNGALCITDRSDYLEENYVDGYNIVYFDLSNPAQMAADVKWLLNNPESAAQIAKKGYQTALKHDTWNHRFDFVLQVMKDVVENQ